MKENTRNYLKKKTLKLKHDRKAHNGKNLDNIININTDSEAQTIRGLPNNRVVSANKETTKVYAKLY